MINELINNNEDCVGKEIDMYAKVVGIKSLGKKLNFLILDKGLFEIQAVFDKTEINEDIKKNQVIHIKGIITKNDAVKCGIKGYEINASEICVINRNDKENIYYKEKFIDKNLRDNLINKSKLLETIRNYFYQNNFIEIKSPKIVSTMIDNYEDVFSVKYFKDQRWLTISNLLYHQIIHSSGLERIFEFGEVFRGTKSKSTTHISEIQMLDFSVAYENIDDIIMRSNKVIESAAINVGIDALDLFKDLSNINVITYEELIKLLSNKKEDISFGEGVSHISNKYKDLLSNNFGKLFWIKNTPSKGHNDFYKKKFQLKSGNSVNESAQLRYLDLGQLADGSVKETDPDKIFFNMKDAMLNVDEFKPYLCSVLEGIIPNSGMGVGIDRLTMALLSKESIADVVFNSVRYR